MSSFGAGGGSMTGNAGGSIKELMKGLGIDKLSQGIGEQMALGQKKTTDPNALVQPGQMARMSPQQRLALTMQRYGSEGTTA